MIFNKAKKHKLIPGEKERNIALILSIAAIPFLAFVFGSFVVFAFGIAGVVLMDVSRKKGYKGKWIRFARRLSKFDIAAGTCGIILLIIVSEY